MKNIQLVAAVMLLSTANENNGMFNNKRLYPKFGSYPTHFSPNTNKNVDISRWHSDNFGDYSINRKENIQIPNTSPTISSPYFNKYHYNEMEDKNDHKQKNKDESTSESKVSFNSYAPLPEQRLHFLPDQIQLDNESLKSLNDIHDTLQFIINQQAKLGEKEFECKRIQKRSDTEGHIKKLEKNIDQIKKKLEKLYQRLYNYGNTQISKTEEAEIPQELPKVEQILELKKQINENLTKLFIYILEYAYSYEKYKILENASVVPNFEVLPYGGYTTAMHVVDILKIKVSERVWKDTTVVQNEIFIRSNIKNVCEKLADTEKDLMDETVKLDSQQKSLIELATKRRSTVNSKTIALYDKEIREKRAEIENTKSRRDLLLQRTQTYQKELCAQSIRLAIYSGFVKFKSSTGNSSQNKKSPIAGA